MMFSNPQASAGGTDNPAPGASARLNSIWDDTAKPPAASAGPGILPPPQRERDSLVSTLKPRNPQTLNPKLSTLNAEPHTLNPEP